MRRQKAITFLQKVVREVKNYNKYNSPLSNNVKEFAYRFKNEVSYFDKDEAEKMLRYYNENR